MKLRILIILFALFASDLRAAVLTGTNTLPSGSTLTTISGSTFTINGGFGGTPTAGNFDMTATTLTIGNTGIAASHTLTLNSTATLSLTGIVSGTPASGTLNLSNLTLTLPAGVTIGAHTLTLGGNLTISGSSALTLTTSGATNVTLPTTGTLQTTAGNGNLQTLQLADSGSNTQTLLAVLTGLAVMPQSFGALADNSHDDTAAIQAAMDTARQVFMPDGIYKVTDEMTKKSIGQTIRGAGMNRTIISQTGTNKSVFKIIATVGGDAAKYKWQGLYSGGLGAYQHGFADMTIQQADASANNGKAIYADGSGSFIGDWVNISNVLAYDFGTGFYFSGEGAVHIDHSYVKTSAANAAASFGTGILITGTTANSAVIESTTVSGLAVGIDLGDASHGFGGGKINAGDVGLCAIGVRLQGGMATIIGGHYEGNTYDVSIGTAASAIMTILGADIVPTGANSSIKVNNSSNLYGFATIAGSSGHPAVELVGAYDHDYLIALPTASDQGLSSPVSFQYVNDAWSQTVRVPTFLDIQNDANLPAANNAFFGQFMRVLNGSSSARSRVVFYGKDGSGTAFVSDMLNDTLLNSTQTVASAWTFSSTLTNTAGSVNFTNGNVGSPSGAGGGITFGSSASGDGYILGLKTSGSALGGFTSGGSLFLNGGGYIYVPRAGNATAGALQTNEWTLYSPATSPAQFGIGMSGTQIAASTTTLWTFPIAVKHNAASTLGSAGTSITNVRHGVSNAMVGGTVTVTDTGCTANTRYFFTTHTIGTITIPSSYYASTRTASTSFVITSSQVTDTSTIDWVAIEP